MSHTLFIECKQCSHRFFPKRHWYTICERCGYASQNNQHPLNIRTIQYEPQSYNIDTMIEPTQPAVSRPQFNNKETSDCKIIDSEGNVLYVHKSVLNVSQFFSNFFDDVLVESEDPSIEVESIEMAEILIRSLYSEDIKVKDLSDLIGTDSIEKFIDLAKLAIMWEMPIKVQGVIFIYLCVYLETMLRRANDILYANLIYQLYQNNKISVPYRNERLFPKIHVLDFNVVVSILVKYVYESKIIVRELFEWPWFRLHIYKPKYMQWILDNNAFDVFGNNKDLPLTMLKVIRNEYRMAINISEILRSSDFNVYLLTPKSIETQKTHTLIINSVVPLNITYHYHDPAHPCFLY